MGTCSFHLDVPCLLCLVGFLLRSCPGLAWPTALARHVACFLVAMKPTVMQLLLFVPNNHVFFYVDTARKQLELEAYTVITDVSTNN